MQEKTWRCTVRVLNVCSASVLIGFQLWYVVALIVNYKWYDVVLRIFAPIFLMYTWLYGSIFGLLIFSSEFKYKKVVEYFRFLQSLNGLAFFNFL